MGDKDNKRGFSGLSDLVSDVIDANDTANSNAKSEKEKTIITNKKSHPERKSMPPDSGKTGSPHTKTQSNYTNSDRWNGNSSRKHPKGGMLTGDKWLIGLGFVFFFLWLLDYSGTENNTRSNSNYESQPVKSSDENKSSQNKNPYHVITQKLNMRDAPSTKSNIVATLSKYDTVSVINKDTTEKWAHINHLNQNGWVSDKYIAQGDGYSAYMKYCRDGVTRPFNGEVFSQKKKGPHSLTVKNGNSSDAIVKLKDIKGSTIISFYVRESSQFTVNSIPGGYYKFQYATGSAYSEICGGIFLDNMSASENSKYQMYEIMQDNNYKYTTRMEYTLYKVSGGNFRPNNISASEF